VDLDSTLRGLQGAAEFDEESVADGFDLGAVEPGKDFAEEATMFFEQFESELIVALGQRAVAHHVREHDGGEFPLLYIGAHGSVNSIVRINTKKGGPVSTAR